MNKEYDKYYETEDLFGKAYPELIDFYSNLKERGNLLDLGCGQGRDSIPLAKLGFRVTGIDNSQVGINQLNEIASKQNLPLTGIVDDLYSYANFDSFEFILLDSIFHFGKKEKAKEIKFLKELIALSKYGTLITICIQKIGKKIDVLNSILLNNVELKFISTTELTYKYVDQASNHSSETVYEMISVQKIKA